jgi:hypothetical protein
MGETDGDTPSHISLLYALKNGWGLSILRSFGYKGVCKKMCVYWPLVSQNGSKEKGISFT